MQRALRAAARRVVGGSPNRRGAVESLRDTWSRYPADWTRNPALKRDAATLGDEWGGPEFADLIVDELVARYLGPDVDVLDLGCGGGKFSQRLAPRCRSLVCADISPTMIGHTRANLAARGVDGNVQYRVISGTEFTDVPDASVDFVFSYDALLHLQPENVFSYMLDARRILREDGVFMLHQINLASLGGCQHFLGQYWARTWARGLDDLGRRGHIYFMSGDQMVTLGDLAGLALDGIGPDVEAIRERNGNRDLIGFFRNRRSRLRTDPGSVALVRGAGGADVYALIDGCRAALRSSGQLERAGLSWDAVQELSDAELAAIPETEPLEPWE